MNLVVASVERKVHKYNGWPIKQLSLICDRSIRVAANCCFVKSLKDEKVIMTTSNKNWLTHTHTHTDRTHTNTQRDTHIHIETQTHTDTDTYTYTQIHTQAD